MRTVPTLTLSVLAMASLEAMAALSISVPPAWLKAEIRLPAQSRSPLVVRLSPTWRPAGPDTVRRPPKSAADNSALPPRALPASR